MKTKCVECGSPDASSITGLCADCEHEGDDAWQI